MIGPHPFVSRRSLLQGAACGFAQLALAGLAAESARAGVGAAPGGPLSPRPPHFRARAKRIIFLFMNGGPAHMDTFDYKPLLQRDNGKPLPFALPKLQQLQKRDLGKLLGSPYKFAQYGQGGVWISELFPELARQADKLCVINSMHTDGVDHGQAILRLHTGADSNIRPAIGPWLVYGLGTENQNLPGMVTVCPTSDSGGVRNYGGAFLPSICQGTAIGTAKNSVHQAKIRYMENSRVPARLQKLQQDLRERMNREYLRQTAGDEQLEGLIESFELAFRMQADSPRVMDISQESPATLKLYGISEPATDEFGTQCLMARRFAEAGVRYIQLTHTVKGHGSNWDQHSNLTSELPVNAREIDRPIAGLLADLEARGLLDDTLVWWGGEFGRTPAAQGSEPAKLGRDHNPFGFTMWLAGGGVKGGLRYGESDDYGYYAAVNKVHMHDLHATLLHLMGLDHERLTYRYAGRDFRLTDVYGNVVREILA
jgi:hypothetical protein